MSNQVLVDSGLQRPTASTAYYKFPSPIKSSSAGFDFHVYFAQSSPEQAEYARQLHKRIAHEFPELPLSRISSKPIGPHPTAMFEVDTFTPHQTGALFSWLVVNRGPCDVFIHPNTGDEYKDHTELATWMGKPWQLDLVKLKQILEVWYGGSR